MAAASGLRSNLALRVVSSVVLMPLAIGATWLGGYYFLAFWTLAALGVLWEWDALVCEHDKQPVFAIGAVALLGTSMLTAYDLSGFAIVFLALGMLGVTTLASRVRRAWCVVGVVYASVLVIAPVTLRSGLANGFIAIIFLFAIVWPTDIVAYFVGRAVDGPKLAPNISPGKTWSGAIGGTIGGVVGGVVTAKLAGLGSLGIIGILALVLSVVSQVGDLFESALKRRFEAKDAGSILPGHGGLMDRLDGFVAAAVVAMLIGMAHGGIDVPARGLMVW